jgi:hypothetical protein
VKSERDVMLGTLAIWLLLLVVVVGMEWAALSIIGLFLMPFLVLYVVLAYLTARRLALRGALLDVPIVKGTVRVRGTKRDVWLVESRDGRRLGFTACGPLVPGMAVLWAPARTFGRPLLGVFHPKLGICTQRVI